MTPGEKVINVRVEISGNTVGIQFDYEDGTTDGFGWLNLNNFRDAIRRGACGCHEGQDCEVPVLSEISPIA